MNLKAQYFLLSHKNTKALNNTKDSKLNHHFLLFFVLLSLCGKKGIFRIQSIIIILNV
jgi:hypothetical protein